MEIKREKLLITSGGKDESGTPVEPEEQLARRVIESASPVSVGGSGFGQPGEGTGKSIPLQILADSSAGSLASNLASLCRFCKHWDQPKAQAMFKEAETSPSAAKKAWVHGLRRKLLKEIIGADPEVVTPTQEAEANLYLKEFGVCKTLTEIFNPGAVKTTAWQVTHSNGGCPEITGPNGEDCSKLFKQKDRESKKLGLTAYDMILKEAAGKK